MKTEEHASTLLLELVSKLNIDVNTRTTAEHLLEDFKGEKSPLVVRCALFAASKSLSLRSSLPDRDKLSQLSVSSLLSSYVDLKTFMFAFNDFIGQISLDGQSSEFIKRIKVSFAFSMTLFDRYEEIWTDIELPCKDKLMKFGWFAFILARVNLLQRRAEMVECACMMLGSIHFILTHLPDGLSYMKNSEDCLSSLCSVLKADIEQVRVSASHLALMVEELKKHNVIRGDVPNSGHLGGILSKSHIDHNLKSLAGQYERLLLPDDVDERDHFVKEENVKYSVPSNVHRFSVQKPGNFINHEDIDFNSKFQDISVVAGEGRPPPTPMNTATELYHWLEETSSEENTEEKLRELSGDVLDELLSMFQEKIKKVFKDLGISNTVEGFLRAEESNKTQTIFQLFRKVLIELVKNENRGENLVAVLRQDTFYRALMACCLEAVLFVHNVTALEFEEVLDLCEVSAFDAWKLMKTFIEFDPKIPVQLREYFRGLENRVITYMAWTEDSRIPQLFRQHLFTNTEITHPALLLLCKRVLSHCASRIFDLSSLLGLNDGTKEDIWSVMKFTLSSHIELLVGRHLDQLIVCAIYGVCKAMNLNITFNSLIAKYSECYADDGSLFRNVKIDDSHGDVIGFYNKVYINHVRTILLEINKKAPVSQHRISAFNPPSSLANSLPAPMAIFNTSPHRPVPTNKPTKGRYYFAESSSSNLEEINKMMMREPLPMKRPGDLLREPPEKIEDIPDGLSDEDPNS